MRPSNSSFVRKKYSCPCVSSSLGARVVAEIDKPDVLMRLPPAFAPRWTCPFPKGPTAPTACLCYSSSSSSSSSPMRLATVSGWMADRMTWSLSVMMTARVAASVGCVNQAPVVLCLLDGALDGRGLAGLTIATSLEEETMLPKPIFTSFIHPPFDYSRFWTCSLIFSSSALFSTTSIEMSLILGL